MTKVSEVVEYLHSIAPNHLQEGYDNAGLIVGNVNDDSHVGPLNHISREITVIQRERKRDRLIERRSVYDAHYYSAISLIPHGIERERKKEKERNRREREREQKENFVVWQ